MALHGFIENDADTSAFQIAQVYALRRDPDKTFEWLARAWVNRDPGIQYLLYDPFILRYRDDPRFATYCEKVGLPIATDAKAQPELGVVVVRDIGGTKIRCRSGALVTSEALYKEAVRLCVSARF